MSLLRFYVNYLRNLCLQDMFGVTEFTYVEWPRYQTAYNIAENYNRQSTAHEVRTLQTD